MLKLIDIKKDYPIGDDKVQALKGVSINFRRNEFVSILGHSGCGKTTLLNIIGGLDQYTTGDLIIEGKSTKDFKDSDWDNYRNHSVGFVFQSYNLIPHQSVLANVELALTLSGVSKSERKAKAKAALEKVGLGDQISKKPNQLSGGQMQRVAIARALVNDPEILLADEPTGALDSETSIQVMDILKEISNDRLVIMVTHNPEIAETYSSRIIRLVDGLITDDTAPYEGEEEVPAEKAEKLSKKQKKPSMSFFTALSLSLTNLLTKKMRTFLTSFAGSIGIIGIALILALSNGFQLYIDSIQRETLTSYPITIDASTMDSSGMMEAMQKINPNEVTHDLDKVYSNSLSSSMAQSFSSGVWFNDLSSFKKFIESDESGISNYISSVKYQYGGEMNIYSPTDGKSLNQVYPSPILGMMEQMMGGNSLASFGIDTSTLDSYAQMYNSWQELIDNEELLKTQYELVEGKWPSAYNEVVLIVDKNNEISDLTIQGLGLTTSAEMMQAFLSMSKGEKIETKSYELDYDEIIGKKFKLITEPEYFTYNKETKEWEDMHDDDYFVMDLVKKAEDLTVVGIIRPDDETLMVQTLGALGYTSALTEYVVNKTNSAEIVKQQKAHPEIDVFTGIPFPVTETTEKKSEEKKEEETTTVKTEGVSAEVFEKPVVSSLGLSGETPSAKFTDTPTIDFSSLPPATEEEVYAAIDEKYSGEEAAKMKRTVELMLKPILTRDERKELIGYLDEMLAGYEIPGMGTISGEQAYSYLSLMSTQDKLKLLNYIITNNLDDPNNMATLPAAEETTEGKKDSKDNKNTDKKDDTKTAEPVTEPEPEPEPYASSYTEALTILGVGDLNEPRQINLYPLDFESKDAISKIIEDYNAANGEEKAIKYTDYIGLLLTSVTKIVNIISYVLISFVAISLVVSSIMIGIITYISVLERTKEIGILRAIGASKRDISRVFNAETLIVGFVSGAIGIGATLLLTIPINLIIEHLTSLPHVAQLPVNGAIILIIISMVLTLTAGLIPSGIASRKDPVEALRTE